MASKWRQNNFYFMNFWFQIERVEVESILWFFCPIFKYLWSSFQLPIKHSKNIIFSIPDIFPVHQFEFLSLVCWYDLWCKIRTILPSSWSRKKVWSLQHFNCLPCIFQSIFKRLQTTPNNKSLHKQYASWSACTCTIFIDSHLTALGVRADGNYMTYFHEFVTTGLTEHPAWHINGILNAVNACTRCPL